MSNSKRFEFPPREQAIFKHTKKIQYWTIVYVVSVVIVMYLALGKSQAMKTAWVDDVLSIIPPIVFFIAVKVNIKPQNRNYPYGYHRANSIAYAVGSSSLLTLGLYLLVESLIKLFSLEHPTIGAVHFLGLNIWLGWLMIPALLWSTIPAIYLGRIKLKPASELHDKILFNDAQMNKASWETAVVAIFGVLGIGIGWWWLDPLAGALISISITNDGYKNLSTAVTDLMSRRPKTVDHKQIDPLFYALGEYFRDMDWIREVQIRLREEGHVFYGEVFIVPQENTKDLISNIREARDGAYNFNWRIHDLVIMPVSELPEKEED